MKYATIIVQHNHPTRLMLAYRTGDVITMVPLTSRLPDYEGARAEAERKLPERKIVVPALGEKTP